MCMSCGYEVVAEVVFYEVLPVEYRDKHAASAMSQIGENTAIAWDIIDENRSHYQSL